MESKNIPYSTILFDFDGTLTSSLPIWIAAYQYALKNFGIQISSEEVVSSCFYRSWADVVNDFEIPSVEVFEDHVKTGLEEAFVNAQLFDGVMPVLETLRTMNIKLGIVTSSRQNVVKKFLQLHNIHEHFDSLITADDIENYKPHPEPVLKALSQLNKNSHEALMVGDSSADMLAAQAANVDKALFFPEEHDEFYDLNELKLHQPEFLFHNYFELLPKLGNTKIQYNRFNQPEHQQSI